MTNSVKAIIAEASLEETYKSDALALKPDNITFEQAATELTSGFIALQNLPNEERLQPGQRVLINGAGGGVGDLAVQIAKSYGADMVRSIGADHVIDYTQEDFTERGERYDLILDISGSHTFSDCRPALTPKGPTYLLDTIPSGRRAVVGKRASLFQTGRDVVVRESDAGSELVDAKQERLHVCPERVD